VPDQLPSLDYRAFGRSPAFTLVLIFITSPPSLFRLALCTRAQVLLQNVARRLNVDVRETFPTTVAARF